MAMGINMNAFFTLFIVCISNKGEDITQLKYIDIALFVSFCVLIAIGMMFKGVKNSFRNDEISGDST